MVRLFELIMAPFICSLLWTQTNVFESYSPVSKTGEFQLRRDGLYNTLDTSMSNCGDKWNRLLVTHSPIIIVNDSIIIYNNGVGARDSNQLELISYKNYTYYGYNSSSYSINLQNTIKAKMPISVFIRGMRLRVQIAHFEGTIKNRDTILNWHMVPPYPDAPAKFNDGFKNLIKPKMLYFIESKELLGLDSLYKMRLREAAQNKRN